MAICVRCNASLNFLEQMGHIGQLKLCSACEKHIAQTIQRIQQQVMHQAAQNAVTDDFCRYVHQELSMNRVPPEQAQALLQQLGYQKRLTDIRKGHLPTVMVNAILDTDEKAHLDMSAIYYKPNKQVTFVHGRIVATNKKLYFITPDRNSMKIDWNNVVNVDVCPGTAPQGQRAILMHIQVSKGSGGGFYYVSDPTYSVAIIGTAVRLWKRHLVELKENPNKQGIPEHVKAQVFYRDGGRCVQCGYVGPYIEYDHIHPRSKGGLNTVGNIQLLCGQCNRRKGNRV